VRFPENFAWGAATASYQIEGAASADGKGPSVWDVFCRQAGRVWNGQSGDVACDHYRRYREDVGLMSEIGLRAYRFSISWPRVLPDGTGKVNEAGLTFYDRLVDALLDAGVEPWVTLFHWDYPHALYCRGGWLNRDSADWFADYATLVTDRLSDRVTHWMTQNEPQCYLGFGHQTGKHAPGLTLPFADVLLATHHSHLAHGKAVQAIRASARVRPAVGFALVGLLNMPATASAEDIQAARQNCFSVRERDCWNYAWFADPLVLGRYPEDGVALFGRDMPELRAGDMQTMCQPLDFFGTNLYFGDRVRAGANGLPEVLPSVNTEPLTGYGFPVTPDIAYWAPRFIYERYGLPVVITENGLAGTDWVHEGGRVADAHRIDFHSRYLRAYGRAFAEGIPARGYFVWSLMDNSEWAHGHRHRFGLVHVDFATQKRTLKDSALWYRDVIAANGPRKR
jgi:beta-glucosidase